MTNDLYIYNTLSRRKEKFIPIKKNFVGMYVCGMTVYDYCHVGNARVWVFFDVVARFLRSIGFAVKYVRNITDIDDKILKRAAELNQNYQNVTARFIAAMLEDEKALNVVRPDFEPRVTENIPEIIDMIKILLKKGFAYVANNEDIYFDIRKFANYGELAQQNLDDMRAGARVEVEIAKRDPLDFVLWKKAKSNEPFWDLKLDNGKIISGRPGWHIECSAMAKKHLGCNIDIHGGGADLQFPHHQNEIAQSECACDSKFVNYWMHVGFVRVDEKKMSKSLGNFFTVREVLKKYHPEVLRFFMLGSHYRSPLNYSTENLDMAKAALERLYNAIRGLEIIQKKSFSKAFLAKNLVINNFYQKLNSALKDDFNTPIAIAAIFDLATEINKLRAENKIDDAVNCAFAIKQAGAILGILQEIPEKFLQGDAIDALKIEQLIAERNLARENKNWARADQIRQELLQQGIVLEDLVGGTIWKKF